MAVKVRLGLKQMWEKERKGRKEMERIKGNREKISLVDKRGKNLLHSQQQQTPGWWHCPSLRMIESLEHLKTTFTVRCPHNLYSVNFGLLLSTCISKNQVLQCLCFQFQHAWTYKGFQLAQADTWYVVSLETSTLINTVVQIDSPWVSPIQGIFGIMGDGIISHQSVKVILGTSGHHLQFTQL